MPIPHAKRGKRGKAHRRRMARTFPRRFHRDRIGRHCLSPLARVEKWRSP